VIVKDLVLKAINDFHSFIEEYEKIEDITFGDDGYEDFFINTYSLLEKMSCIEPKDTGFVILGCKYIDEFDENGEMVFQTKAYKKYNLDQFSGYDDVAKMEKDNMTTEDKIEFMANHPLPISYAYEMTSWDEVLGMEINEDNLAKFSVWEMLSDILYEMTFFGDEEDMMEQKNELNKMVDEIENMTEEDIADRLVDVAHFFDDVVDKYTDQEWEKKCEHYRNIAFENWLLNYTMLSSIIK